MIKQLHGLVLLLTSICIYACILCKREAKRKMVSFFNCHDTILHRFVAVYSYSQQLHIVIPTSPLLISGRKIF